jgi:hypothetical protein
VSWTLTVSTVMETSEVAGTNRRTGDHAAGLAASRR